jgi:hypothetical protein
MLLFIGEETAATSSERLAICVESGGSGKFVDIIRSPLFREFERAIGDDRRNNRPIPW